MSHFVRLVPYDKKRGALCKRYTIGGRTFLEGKWYRMDPSWTVMVKDLEQGSGCPVFEIVESETAWRELVRKELAIKMAGPEAAQIAMLLANEAPLAKEPKDGMIKSRFEGLSAGDVSATEEARAGVKGVVDAPVEVPPPQGSVDDGPKLGEMTKAELLATAEEYGVDGINDRMLKAEILEKLESEIYGD